MAIAQIYNAEGNILRGKVRVHELNSTSHTTYKIGLTGGIGSGKSTVASAFAALGVPCFSADAIAHELSQQGQSAYVQIVERFGTGILLKNGELDRARLGDLIFNDEALKTRLEGILHPLIMQTLHQRADAAGSAYCILDIPLLINSRERDKVDRILVVNCARSTRIERVKQRSGWSDEKIANVMRKQVSEQALLEAADDLIDNNGDISGLDTQVAELNRQYLELAERTTKT